jgi:hypothetical protein
LISSKEAEDWRDVPYRRQDHGRKWDGGESDIIRTRYVGDGIVSGMGNWLANNEGQKGDPHCVTVLIVQSIIFISRSPCFSYLPNGGTSNEIDGNELCSRGHSSSISKVTRNLLRYWIDKPWKIEIPIADIDFTDRPERLPTTPAVLHSMFEISVKAKIDVGVLWKQFSIYFRTPIQCGSRKQIFQHYSRASSRLPLARGFTPRCAK